MATWFQIIVVLGIVLLAAPVRGHSVLPYMTGAATAVALEVFFPHLPTNIFAGVTAMFSVVPGAVLPTIAGLAGEIVYQLRERRTRGRTVAVGR
jgi:hypothetical protein